MLHPQSYSGAPDFFSTNFFCKGQDLIFWVTYGLCHMFIFPFFFFNFKNTKTILTTGAMRNQAMGPVLVQVLFDTK